MKIKTIYLLISFLHVSNIILYPASGAGIFFYRFNSSNELQFLFAFDPGQRKEVRLGFEQPGGRVDQPTIDNFNKGDQPIKLLRGAIREALEELIFVPAQFFPLKNKSPYKFDQDTKKLVINEQYKLEAIQTLKEFIQQQGVFYILKNRINPDYNPGYGNQNAIFFCDLTQFSEAAHLPKLIAEAKVHWTNELKRQLKNHLKGAFDENKFNKNMRRVLQSIDAEPIAWAWVNVNQLLPLIKKETTDQWAKPTRYAEYDYTNNSAITDITHRKAMGRTELDQKHLPPHKSIQTDTDGYTKNYYNQNGELVYYTRYNTYKNKTEYFKPRYIAQREKQVIRISNATIGMISDRSKNTDDNQQDNTITIFNLIDGTSTLYYFDQPPITKQNSSSMLAVINYLEDKYEKTQESGPTAAAEHKEKPTSLDPATATQSLLQALELTNLLTCTKKGKKASSCTIS